jgi:hypothetical protein
MADALTAIQLEILRRVRDGASWSGEPAIAGELRETLLLCALGLVDHAGFPCQLSLTPLGRAYLAAAERSAPAAAASSPLAQSKPPLHP